MWARIDDQLPNHPKIVAAGAAIGEHGPLLALGLYVLGLTYANQYLTDGHLTRDVIKSFVSYTPDPFALADALVASGLWERNGNGFVIHDYVEFGNPRAADIKAKRKKDRLRKRRERADA